MEKRKNLPARLCACLLTLLLLAFTPAAGADSIYPKALTAQEYQTLNLFLSNFTEVGVGEISPFSPDQVLVDFAHDHLWCNRHDDFEFGEYFDGYNCRVADTDIQSVIDDYFYDAPQVDLSQTRLTYRDGYYYHQETGGWSSGGFALSASACALAMANGSYPSWCSAPVKSGTTTSWASLLRKPSTNMAPPATRARR